jgi:SAM-dependent methyltransferase
MDRVVGIDISSGMLATARRRCGASRTSLCCGAQGVISPYSGTHRLIWSTPSIRFRTLYYQAGDFAERHMRDIARVLRPLGTLLVLNYSYSGDIERDRREIAAFGRATDLQVVRDGTRDFTTWDAVTFQMVRAP